MSIAIPCVCINRLWFNSNTLCVKINFLPSRMNVFCLFIQRSLSKDFLTDSIPLLCGMLEYKEDIFKFRSPTYIFQALNYIGSISQIRSERCSIFLEVPVNVLGQGAGK